MTDELEEVVKVLYDYTYLEDNGKVEIKQGDIYRLIEKTNTEWWEVYDPTEYDGESFFVPAQYVEIVPEKSPWKALSDLDKVLTFGEDDGEDSDSSESPINDPESPINDPKICISETESKQNITASNNATTQMDVRIDTNVLPKIVNNSDDGEYVNLDEFRKTAGITTQPSAKPSNTHSINEPVSKPPVSQELIQGSIPPPLPTEGTFVKVLVKGLPWDIYKEPTLGRNYYVNRETGERMWKPPRKDKPSSEQPKSPITPPQNAVSSAESWPGIPPEYEQVHDNGSVYFIHKSTQEKWKSLVDKVGRKYFHKVGSSETLWTLPTTPLTIDKDLASQNTEQVVQSREVKWESQGLRMSTFGTKSVRATKAMSSYGQLEISNPINRASTLPSNFMAVKPVPVSNVISCLLLLKILNEGHTQLLVIEIIS